MPPVGTLAQQETSEVKSGTSDTGNETRLIDWVSRHRQITIWLARADGCQPTHDEPLGCPLPNPNTHQGEEVITCDDCGVRWRRHPVVPEWFRWLQ